MEKYNEANRGKRFLLSADAHLYEKEGDALTQEKFQKGEESWLDIPFDIYRRGNERRFKFLTQEAKKVNGVDYLFFMGDMVTGYGERGLSGPDSQEYINKFKKLLDDNFGNTPKKFVAGGHELGYTLAWSWDEKGGLNERAIEMFEDNFNELFFTFQEDQYKFIILSSDLELNKDNQRLPESVQRKIREQGEFYKNMISETRKDEKIVLMLHDPDALNPMFDFLEHHLNKIEKTFVGHHHAQWTTTIQKYLYQMARATNPIIEKLPNRIVNSSLKHLQTNKDNAKIWQSMKLVTVPAPGGNFGIGGGFLLADLTEEGLDVKKVNFSPDLGWVVGKS